MAGRGGYFQQFSRNDFTVYSAEDQEKRTILRFQEDMLEQMAVYSTYSLAQVNKVLEKERFQASIIKLYHKLRSHINAYYARQEKSLERKMKSQRKPNPEEQRNIRESVEKARYYVKELDDAFRGNFKDEFLYECAKFLDTFILEYGISRIEREAGDPLKNFSEEAYGKDYEE